MTLRMRVLPRFPAKISSGAGINIARTPGSADLVVSVDVSNLVRVPSVADGNKVFFLAWNSDLNSYSIMSFTDTFQTVIDTTGLMLQSVYDPQEIEADAFARENHTGTQAISTVSGLQTALDAKASNSQLAAAVAAILADPWALQPLGALIPANMGLAGFSAPPKNLAYRYVLLTAGQTGAGAYNQGILTSESTSGSTPTVSSTGVISLAGSPFNGNTVRLINTERRFLRAGSAGSLEDSQNLSHAHTVTDPGHVHAITYQAGPPGTNYNGGQIAGVASLVGPVSFNAQSATTGISIQSNGGTEARSRNIGVEYYMRIL
ncbi:hypothetical protein ACQZ46_02685 [Agrobacterium salinitolerans]